MLTVTPEELALREAIEDGGGVTRRLDIECIGAIVDMTSAERSSRRREIAKLRTFEASCAACCAASCTERIRECARETNLSERESR